MNIKELQEEFQKKLSEIQKITPNGFPTSDEEAKLRDFYQVLYLSAESDLDQFQNLSLFEKICIASGLRSPHNVQARI